MIDAPVGRLQTPPFLGAEGLWTNPPIKTRYGGQATPLLQHIIVYYVNCHRTKLCGVNREF